MHVLNLEHMGLFAGVRRTECAWGRAHTEEFTRLRMYFVLVAKYDGLYGSVELIYMTLLSLGFFFPASAYLSLQLRQWYHI